MIKSIDSLATGLRRNCPQLSQRAEEDSSALLSLHCRSERLSCVLLTMLCIAERLGCKEGQTNHPYTSRSSLFTSLLMYSLTLYLSPAPSCGLHSRSKELSLECRPCCASYSSQNVRRPANQTILSHQRPVHLPLYSYML